MIGPHTIYSREQSMLTTPEKPRKNSTAVLTLAPTRENTCHWEEIFQMGPWMFKFQKVQFNRIFSFLNLDVLREQLGTVNVNNSLLLEAESRLWYITRSTESGIAKEENPKISSLSYGSETP